MVELMSRIGNVKCNRYWEKNMPPNYQKPNYNSTQEEIEDFVRKKYVNREFAPSNLPDPLYILRNGLDENQFENSKKYGFYSN